MAADEGSTSTTANRRASSSAPSSQAPSLDNNDLLAEILLRLPPRHASLHRAARVCRRWRRVAADPAFLRRWRRVAADPAFLRRFRARTPSPPLLVYFTETLGAVSYNWVVDPPGGRRPRDLDARFLDIRRPGERWSLLGCRHGFVLLTNRSQREAVVWDPNANLQHRAPYPPEFKADGVYGFVCNGAVVCAAASVHGAGDCHHFKVILVRLNSDSTEATACLYESKLRTWGSITSTKVTSTISSVMPSTSVMVGNVLYWLLCPTILEFDLDTQRVSATRRPPEAGMTGDKTVSIQIARTHDGELGLAVASELSIKLWARKVSSSHGGHGTVEWVLQKTIDLEQLLSLTPGMLKKRWRLPDEILGFDEDNNVNFVKTLTGIVMIQLQSNRFRKLPIRVPNTTFPYTSFYIKRRKIGGRDA